MYSVCKIAWHVWYNSACRPANPMCTYGSMMIIIVEYSAYLHVHLAVYLYSGTWVPRQIGWFQHDRKSWLMVILTRFFFQYNGRELLIVELVFYSITVRPLSLVVYWITIGVVLLVSIFQIPNMGDTKSVKMMGGFHTGRFISCI